MKNEEYTSVNWNDTYGPQFSEIYKRFDLDYGYVYMEAELLEGSLEVIEKLIENGDKVFFVTARQKAIENITKEWLKKVGLDKIETYSLDGNDSKVLTAKKLNCTYFIEDDPNNATNLLNEGISVILLDNNYNKDVEGEKLIRVKNWKNIEDVLLNK